MRPPLSSQAHRRKPRGSEIRACSHSDLGEFLFWWRNCYWGEKIEKILIRFLEFPSVKFLKIWQKSYSLLAFLCFQFIRKICKTRFSPSQKKQKNAKNEKTTMTTPTFFDFKSFFLLDYIRILSISENFTEGNWRKLKSKPNRRQKMAMFKEF